MKLFILKSSIFISVIIVAIIALGNQALDKSIQKSDYMSAIIDKHERLNSLQSPRLIFCGESNLAFGLDCEKIEKEIGIPTVNLGLHGSLGLEFILNEVKLNMRKDDIIILSFAYNLKKTEDYSLMMHTASIYPEASNYFTSSYVDKIKYGLYNRLDFFSNRFSNFQNNFNYLKKNKKRRSDWTYKINPYSRSAFDKYGDVIGHLDDTLIHPLSDRRTFSYHYYKEIALLNEFYNECVTKDVNVYFIYPPYPVSEYEINKTVINKYYSDFKKDMKIPIILTPGDFIYNDNLFFDTVYHLNKKGREKRTNTIIEALQKLNLK